MESKTYNGSCHCKANTFKVTVSPPLEDGHEVNDCNCSICTTNGYRLAIVSDDSVTWEKGGLDTLKKYKFGSRNLSHYFCPECGTSLAAGGSLGGVSKIGISIRALEGVDVSKLKLKPFDGKAM
ncbi:DUF636 domain protein [Microthyrium microscopicum]|uniref:DUF636 domain protein n=1 Tax=Microthyrium microscopicum TaxID=703497 RepID=A0A6A6UK07_9PEZI|nr:DUF636 domain protein [Microthyrium microscopicum]